MISRDEANKATAENITKFINSEMAEIEKRIVNAVKEGEYSISYNGYLKQETKDVLKSLGYTIKIGNQYNDSYYNISWK